MKLAIIVGAARQVKSWLWMLGALPFVLAAGCNQVLAGPTETRDDSFAVGESPNVIVRSFNGRIVVNIGAASSVRVRAVLKRPDELEYEATQQGDTVTVEAKEKGSGIFKFGGSPGASIEITAPATTHVELRTSNGSIQATGMQRSGNARTSNGKITLEDITGDFEVSSSNGKVTITRASGSFQVGTSNGGIEFDGGLAAGGDNSFTTSNGSIDIKLQGTPSVALDASTSNGSISTDLPVLTTSPGDEHHVVGRIGDGDAELLVKTSNGSITIR